MDIMNCTREPSYKTKIFSEVKLGEIFELSGIGVFMKIPSVSQEVKSDGNTCCIFGNAVSAKTGLLTLVAPEDKVYELTAGMEYSRLYLE